MVADIPIAKLILLLLLGGIAIVFAVAWGFSLRSKVKEGLIPSFYQAMVGFVTDFLDTLGIGSFATTTSLYRLPKTLGVYDTTADSFASTPPPSSFFGKPVDDDNLPGTLNVGHTLPTILQALIYISVVKIDLWTLWLLIAASVAGSYVGASFVSRLPLRAVQVGVGLAMLVAAGLMFAKLRGLIPPGGETLGLRGGYLMIGIVGNFIFGALMTIGVGAYAPIMIMVSLLGMDQKAAFPLMMGSCAFLMPVASYKFVTAGKYDARAALGLTLLGLPGVAIAAKYVQELKGTSVNWLVLCVVIYTALVMLYSATRKTRADAAISTASECQP
jgi:uncharacterized membrane protein YfcA